MYSNDFYYSSALNIEPRFRKILKLMDKHKEPTKVIVNNLKNKFCEAKGLRDEEVSSILWGYHCNPESSKKETSFRLTYGSGLSEASWRRQLY